ncbi:alpha-2-macroglobulin family protein [Advenella mimigardefordensis]|uniref:Putative large extracellular alpha-helical protein n=1 Tax=Advenella mimigardefordensis (strain DSM 17166 / LMG 22922 / DPN7) TaxID=1247726 RepID=W0PDM1_ADVMD|nr:MG2 domain-containing protein [Advenella mimigardefordensis]AHG64846.1 putative large extracellular alpha-helical protein [Advenella mimigardefordensis DPN7]
MKCTLLAGAGLVLAGVFGSANAADIASVSPTGTQSKVSAVDIVFSTNVIPLGRNDLPPPASVSCKGSQIKGHGKWSDGAHWSYEFEEVLPAGVQCTITPDTTFRDTAGQAVKGKKQYQFDTGRLAVESVGPSSLISEDQAFTVRFNLPVQPDSLQANASCVVQGLGEQIPVKVLSEQEKKTIISEARPYLEDDADKIAFVQCARRLPAEAQGRLVIGQEVSSLGGVTMRKPYESEFEVRRDFSAGFSCSRENQNADCSPARPVYLTLSESINREDMQGITLVGATGKPYPAEIDENDTTLGSVKFPGPFAEKETLTLTVPAGLKDDSGRALSNAGQFPMKVRMASYSPMLKFASSTFGIIERKADAVDGKAPWHVPLTVRYIENQLAIRDQSLSPGTISDYVPQEDADVLKAFARVRRLDETSMTARNIRAVMNDQPASYTENNPVYIDTRSVSMLAENPNATTITLPGVKTAARHRDFEVLGVPLQEPGFHVLEARSASLGQALLANKNPMYVRSSVLVTNMAVHVKKGRDDLLVWVTTLDDAKPVANAQVNVLDCSGKTLVSGQTGNDGIWHYRKAVKGEDYCNATQLSGLFVSARIGADHPQGAGLGDYSFAFTSWDNGIESWRFNVPTDSSPQPTVRAHTIMDRSLFRAGETASMKHLLRTLTRDGFAQPDATSLPTEVSIELVGGEDQYKFPLKWQKTAGGGLFSTSEWKIPEDIKRGQYRIVLGPDEQSYETGEFRVEDFKLPLLAGQISVTDPAGDKGPLIAPQAVRLDMQMHYLSGGGAGRLPVDISALSRERSVAFRDYDDYSFNPPQALSTDTAAEDDEVADDSETSRIIVNKQKMTLDAQGHGTLAVDALPASDSARNITFEGSFMDPNGQVQTLSRTVAVWPAAYLAGIRTGYMVEQEKAAAISVVAVDTQGKPAASVPVSVRAVSYTYQTVRKRLVGGFYSYDSHRVAKDLGTICTGTSGADGKFACDISLKDQGRISLIAEVTDSAGRRAQAESSVYVVGAGEMWFSGENNDRIDIISDKKEYQPGETAQFQVRMPFRQANALVAIEREGVLETRQVALSGTNPSFSIQIKPQWGPNVYVSVLALRGRVRDSAQNPDLTWGEAGAALPTALIDLAKPAYRFGLAAIRVRSDNNALKISIATDKPRYQIRDQATATIRGTLPDGSPAANASVALAVVDEALLELAPNDSWDIVKAMMGERSYGVETSTAQMEVVGRRHYGRKALPPGGGGGNGGAPTRELLDSLVFWKPDIVLDASGQATIPLGLNDAISGFRLAAVAELGADRFGQGSAHIVTTQDLQVISGLPLVARSDDHYTAAATLRNATDRAMTVQVSARLSGPALAPLTLKAHTVSIPAQSSQRVTWDMDMRSLPPATSSQTLKWRFDAREQDANTGSSPTQVAAMDSVEVSQLLIPTVPVTVRQATLQSVQAKEPIQGLPIQPPAGSVSGADGRPLGGVQVQLSTSLAKGLEPVRRWFTEYQYTCLEQLSSIAIGIDNPQRWSALMNRLPVYMDGNGLVAYFPGLKGDEVLTAHLLAVSHEASRGGQPYTIPKAYRERMLEGLMAYVTGKISATGWQPKKDNSERRLMVLEALSRVGMVTPSLLSTIEFDRERMSTAALVDWLSIVSRVKNLPDQAETLASLRSGLLARMSRQGTSLVFADDTNAYPWWMMSSRSTVTAKLLVTVMNNKAWQKDIPVLLTGLLSQQQRGTWGTTTANVWGTLAVRAFSASFEKTPVKGTLSMSLQSAGAAAASADQQWEGLQPTQKILAPWKNSEPQQLSLSLQGTGRVWASVAAQAAVPVTKPVYAGYTISRSIIPVSQAVSGQWSVGDIYRVHLDISAKATMTWVVLSDPIPTGATILGGGLGRDSAVATEGEKTDQKGWPPSFAERKSELYRAYYAWLPAGKTSLEYTVRLNTPGSYSLPATRVEAMYAPQVYGELPNTEGFTIVESAGEAPVESAQQAAAAQGSGNAGIAAP